MQVSDRFHLWQGLSKQVSDIAAAHRGCLPAAVAEPEPAAPPPSSAEPSAADDTPARRHAKRLLEAVHTVADSGRSLSAMARELGLNRRTVAKYARAASWQECVRRTPPRRSTSLDPYLEYLQQRWEEGEHTATVLHQEIAAKGYLGHYQRVKMAIAPLRRGLPISTPRERPPSPRQVARWITATPSRRSLHTTEALRRLLEHCPELDRTHNLVRQFAAMLGARDAVALPDWLDQLAACRLLALSGLAKALRDDQAAVVQGITTAFNSGVNEGRITDLILWNQNCQACGALPCRTSAIGRRVEFGGTSSWRGVGLAGVGMSARRPRRRSRAAWPSSTAACSSSDMGIIARIFCKLPFASSSWALLESFGV
ncbi:hypothetical protein [Streptomyces spectabilis]|uniref:hypothetical protein n=1 Tax=Streptomyces spectabilis TaxID=68270 RepID=UPI003411BDD5